MTPSPIQEILDELQHTFRALRHGRGLRGRLARTALGSVAVKVAATRLAFLASVVLARLLGSSGYGIYSYAFSVAMLLAVVAQLGLPELVLREIAALAAEKEWSVIRALLIRAEQAVLTSSLLIIIIAGVVILLLPGWPAAEQTSTLLWALGLVPVLALSEIRSGSLKGLQRVVLGLLPKSVMRPTALILLLLLMSLLTGAALKPSLAMALHAAAAAIGLVMGTWWLLQSLPAEVRLKRSNTRIRKWSRATIPFLLLGIVHMVNGQVDILMLGTLRPAEELGAYRVAVALATLVPFFLSAANAVIQPEVSRLYSTGDRSTLQRLVTTEARWILLFTAPIVLVLLVFGRDILRIMYGADFQAGYAPLAILAVGQLANVGMGPVILVLNMTGLQRESLNGVSLAAGFNVVANATLVPLLGPIGAALANAGSLIFWNGFLVYRLQVRLGIDSTALGRV